MSKYFQATKAESISLVSLNGAYSPLLAPSGSPVDLYYSRVEALVVRAQKAQQEGEEELIPLLFLRLISATESYVRDLLSRLPAICPLVWSKCSDQPMPLGAAFHYEKATLAVATLEHVSFSTKGEVRKQTEKITGLQTGSDGSLRVALEAFESISELRHSVVHSFDELFYKNLKEMKILDSSSARYSVSISPLLFQSFVAVCHSFVRAYNRFLLDSLLDSWVDKSLLSMNWANDKEKFVPVFEVFRSVRDGVGPSNAYRAFQKFSGRVLANVTAAAAPA